MADSPKIRRPKRIALVVTRLDLGGAQKVVLYLVEHLDRTRYEVHLLTGRGGLLDARAAAIKNQRVVFVDSLKHPLSPGRDPRAVWALKNYFVRNQIEIVHTHTSKAGLLGRMAGRLAGTKKILHTVHGFPFHRYQNPLVHLLYLEFERWAAKWSDRLVAVGRDVKSYGLKKGVGREDQYRIIRAGIAMERFKNLRLDRRIYLKKAGLDPRRFTVGMIGNLKKEKNPAAFIEIARRVLARDRNMQFLFAGGGPRKGRIDARLRQYGLGDRVKFLGWVERPDRFLAAIDLFLFTSLKEGLPCVLAEAAAAGKTIIATDIDGNREMLDLLGRGALYPPFDHDAAAAKILYFKNHPPPANAGPRASPRLREFEAERMLKQYEKIYDE
jgi:glycosyltransferase involved in cell wall biosynthesis